MSRRELELLCGKLNRKLKDLTHDSGRTSDLIAERLADPIEEVQSQVSAAVTVSIINTDWVTQRAIEAALGRIQTGDYGICECCGEPIRPKRLNAIPWAALCVPCQSHQEAAEDLIRVYQKVA